MFFCLTLTLHALVGAGQGVAAESPPKAAVDMRVFFDGERATMGQGGPVLPGADFYAYVGDHHLARQYRDNDFQRQKWGTIGGQLIGMGMMSTLAGSAGFLCDTWQWTCHDAFSWAFFGGLGVSAGGALIMTWAILSDPHPLDLEARKRMAETFNQKNQAAQKPQATLSQSLIVVPYWNAQSTGFSLAMVF